MKSLCVLFFSFTLIAGQKCPPEDYIKPHCWCLSSFYGGALLCQDFNSPTELLAPIEACQGYNVTALGIYNSTLLYFPKDLFKGTIFAKISLINTTLMSLSNGPLAFQGLETTLTELRATQTHYVTQWRLGQLRQLKKLQLIDINYIHMDAIEEDLPEFPELTAIGLIHAGLTFLGDETFAKCPKLSICDLRHNYITELKRSMFPNPASNLLIFNLEGNDLSSFPNDFFTNMPALDQVLLADNHFTTILEIPFRPVFSQLGILDLTRNAIRCDCRILWLVKSRQPFDFLAKCDQPPTLEGASLKLLSSRDLHC